MSANEDKNIKQIRTMLKVEQQSRNQIQAQQNQASAPPNSSSSSQQQQNLINYSNQVDSMQQQQQQQYQLEQRNQSLAFQPGNFFPGSSNGLQDNSPQLQRPMLPNLSDIATFSRAMPPPPSSGFSQFQMLGCPPVNQLGPQTDQILINLLGLQSLKPNSYLQNPTSNQFNVMMLQNNANNLGNQVSINSEQNNSSLNGQQLQMQHQDQNQQSEQSKLKKEKEDSPDVLVESGIKDSQSENNFKAVKIEKERSGNRMKSSESVIKKENSNKIKIQELQVKDDNTDEKKERDGDQEDLLVNVISDEQAMGIYKRLNAAGSNSQNQSKLRGDRRVKRNWHHSQTQLLYWVIKSYSKTQKIDSKELSMADWQKISQFVPGRNANQCQYKWQSNHKPKSSKAPWTAQQDARLKQIVTEKGAKSWAQISRLLNVERIGPIRQGKQCRERWFNHVNPAIKWESWTQWEDITLLQKQQSMGNKWSEIAKCIPGRTQNSVKNRFNSLAKKERTKLQQKMKAKNNTKADNAIDLKSSMNSFFKVKQSQGSHQTWIKPLLVQLMSQFKIKHNSDYDMNNCPKSELNWQNQDQIKDQLENDDEDPEMQEQEDDQEEEEDEDQDEDQYEDGEQDKEVDSRKVKQIDSNKRGMTKRLKKEKQMKEDSRLKEQPQILQPDMTQMSRNDGFIPPPVSNEEIRNFILSQQQQQAIGGGNLLMPPQMAMHQGFQLNRMESGEEIVTGGGIVIRSPNPSGGHSPLHTLEELTRDGKVAQPEFQKTSGPSHSLQDGTDIFFRGNSDRETQLMLQKYMSEYENQKKQEGELSNTQLSSPTKKPSILINSEQQKVSKVKLQNLPYYRKNSRISSQGCMTFGGRNSTNQGNLFQDNRSISQRGRNSVVSPILQSYKVKGKKLDDVSRTRVVDESEMFFHNQNFNVLIFLTSDAVYLDQQTQMIKLCDFNQPNNSFTESNNSSNTLQQKKSEQLDKVEQTNTIATNLAQRGSLFTEIREQNNQNTVKKALQESFYKRKKTIQLQNSNNNNKDEQKQQESQDKKNDQDQFLPLQNIKQKQQSFRRGSSSFLSTNQRGSLTPIHFDQVSQVSQKRNSINQTYPNFFATGPPPKESKNNSNMCFGANLGVPFYHMYENFQSNGFLDSNTPMQNFQERSNNTKTLSSGNNFTGSGNQSGSANQSNFNSAAATAVAANENKSSNSMKSAVTPICSSSRLPMRMDSSNDVNQNSESVVQPQDFMATFGGQPLEEYTNAQQRASANEAVLQQLRASTCNQSNKTAPSYQQESNRSMSSINFSNNLPYNRNAPTIELIPSQQHQDTNNNFTTGSNFDFGGMFPPTRQTKPLTNNNSNNSHPISDLNMNNLNLLSNNNHLQPQLSIFPPQNEGNKSTKDTNNSRTSIFDRTKPFMGESIFNVPSDSKSSRIANIVQNPQQNVHINSIVDQVRSLCSRSWPASYDGASVKFVRNTNPPMNFLGQRDNAFDARSLSELSAPFQPYSAPAQFFQLDRQSQHSLAGLQQLSANQGGFKLNCQKGGNNNNNNGNSGNSGNSGNLFKQQ